MKVGEKRYFRWGNEKPGMVTVWTIREDRSVKIIGQVDMHEAWANKWIHECPYP
jgi:hypothetical protein